MEVKQLSGTGTTSLINLYSVLADVVVLELSSSKIASLMQCYSLLLAQHVERWDMCSGDSMQAPWRVHKVFSHCFSSDFLTQVKEEQ